MLVEHWFFEAHEIYHQARAVYIGELKWDEIEWSGKVNLVSYTLEYGLKKHLISMKARIFGEGGRGVKRQQTVYKMDNEKRDNVQEIVQSPREIVVF